MNASKKHTSGGPDGREWAQKGKVAYFSDLSAVADGIRLLSTMAPGIPTPLSVRLSSVMVFWRNKTIGMLQKSVSDACSRTTLAILSAPSLVMSLPPTLYKMGVKRRRQLALAVGKERVMTYSTRVSKRSSVHIVGGAEAGVASSYSSTGAGEVELERSIGGCTPTSLVMVLE